MRTLKQNLKLNKEQFSLLKKYCKHSNSLYNSALYLCNQYFKETGSYIGLKNLDKEMQSNFHYKELPSFNAQDIIRLVDQNFRSFFALINKKKRSEYADNINTPKYKKKNDLFILIFNNQRIKYYKDKNILKLYKNLRIKFNYSIDNIKQGIIKWNGYNFVLYVSYEQRNEILKSDNKNYLGIDLGINNLASCISNVGMSFLINGKPLKSYNKFYNKQKAKIQSELKIKNNKFNSKKLCRLEAKRKNFINNYFYNSIAFIIKKVKEKNINTIIIGYNEGWKTNVNLGKINNQTFVNIPYALFRSVLKSKCEKEGINLIQTEESYTSKCSFLDLEPLKNNESFLGKREGKFFYTKENKKIHADLNGASNIIRKVIPMISIKGIEAFIVKPEMKFTAVKSDKFLSKRFNNSLLLES